MLKCMVLCILMTTASAGHPYSRISFTPAASDGHGDGFYYQVGTSLGGSKSKVSDVQAAVLSADSNIRHDGFDYHVETSDGASSKASGDHSGRIHGNFKWVSPEGEHVALSYVADEHGYQPSGTHLPTPPPIPKAILKSLEYNEKHPYKEEEKEHEHHHLHYEHEHTHAYAHEHEHQHFHHQQHEHEHEHEHYQLQLQPQHHQQHEHHQHQTHHHQPQHRFRFNKRRF